MGLLQYTSNEMFSSTELVRKSKNIFDKLNKNDIEKAIVLRDGKPAVILLDFTYYEEIMKDYLQLKEQSQKSNESIKKEVQKLEVKETIKEENIEKSFQKPKEEDFSFDSDLSTNKPEPLKEFWD
jgi:PHD/YefM family antitoxin component YafN of YafNO toxin-antitoxin module